MKFTAIIVRVVVAGFLFAFVQDALASGPIVPPPIPPQRGGVAFLGPIVPPPIPPALKVA